MYCSVRGIKVPCIYEEKVWLYKTLFENIALFSLPLNGIFLFLQLEVIILDLDPANSFIKKDKSFFNRNNIVAFNKKKKPTAGPGSAWRCFYQEDKK